MSKTMRQYHGGWTNGFPNALENTRERFNRIKYKLRHMRHMRHFRRK